MSVYDKPLVIDLRQITNPNIAEELKKYNEEIHNKIFRSIQEALAKDENEIQILKILLSDSEIYFNSNRKFWLENLEHTLAKFTELEQYEKCSEIAELIKKL